MAAFCSLQHTLVEVGENDPSEGDRNVVKFFSEIGIEVVRIAGLKCGSAPQQHHGQFCSGVSVVERHVSQIPMRVNRASLDLYSSSRCSQLAGGSVVMSGSTKPEDMSVEVDDMCGAVVHLESM